MTVDAVWQTTTKGKYMRRINYKYMTYNIGWHKTTKGERLKVTL